MVATRKPRKVMGPTSEVVIAIRIDTATRTLISSVRWFKPRFVATAEPSESVSSRRDRSHNHVPTTSTIGTAKGRYSVLALRSEEHTSELQSRGHLVCRLLLEKKKEIKAY